MSALAGYQLEALNKFLSLVPENSTSILEVGSDIEYAVVDYLSTRFNGEVVGINPTPGFVKREPHQGPPNVTVLEIDGCHQPFETNTFDAILSIATLEHVDDVPQFLAECWRVLKPGGVFYTSFGPIFSSGVGHHVCAIVGKKEARFWKPDRNIVPDFAHLLWDEEQMRNYFLDSPYDDRLIEPIINWIYHSSHINRNLYEDYVDAFEKSKFCVLEFTPSVCRVPDEETQKKLAEKYGAAREFRYQLIEAICMKKVESAVSDVATLQDTKNNQKQIAFPKISVVTPSFNQAQYIEKTIQSVVAQNYPNFEHIVIDGASTDGTVDILKRYPHLTWVSEKDRGQTDALNKGLKMATGEIIAWINSDDYYQEDAFNKVARYFQQNPNAQFVFGDCLFTYGGRREDLYVKNKALSFEDIIRYWDRWIPPTQPTIFFKSSLLDEFGYFDETLHLAMDYDFWVRVSQKYQLHYIPACLAVYRFHEASKSALGTDWQHFYPEWHKVYTRYKSHSRLLGNTSKLLTIAVPLLHDELKRSKDHVGVIQNMISMFVTKIAKETEIIIVSDIENAAELLDVGDVLVDVSFELVKELNTASFLKTVYCKSRGLAFHCPPLIKNLPVHWYIEALDLLLDTQGLEFVENKTLSFSHPLLGSHGQVDTRKLVRINPVSAHDKYRNNSSLEQHIQISIVIPTFNRRELLKEAIDSIAVQTYGGRFELIIVDDGSSDGTEEMVREKIRNVSFPLIYLAQKNAGPAAARNKGVSFANGDLVAFTDSDCVADKRWLDALVRHFSNPEIAGVGGIAVSRREDALSKYFDYTGLYNSRLLPDKSGVIYLLTLNACYRKQALIDVGLFSQDFKNPGGEDPELCIRLKKKGYRLLFESSAIVVHNHKADLVEFYSTFYRYGIGKALIYNKHGIWGENRKLEDLVTKENLIDFNSNCISSGVDQDSATTFTALHYLQEIALFCGYQDKMRELGVDALSGQKANVAVNTNLRASVLSSSKERMKKYENIHAGKRCVIIGNGPSLNKMDLSFLEHEICFGMNRIFLLFNQWKFRPTYYVAVNQLVIEQSKDEILALPMPKFLSQRGIPYFDNPPDDLMFIDERKEWVFSKDPYAGMHEGWTVTYVAMQLAYFMGFSEVVLIGVDHNFVAPGDPNKEVVSQGDDPNHFHPDYFGKGMRWHLPDLERSEHSYQLAKEAFESSGRRIVDATLGGKLTIFPKVDYKEHFLSQTPFMPQQTELSQAEIIALMGKFIRYPDEITGVKLVNALRSKHLHSDADQVQQIIGSLRSGGR